MPDDEIDESEQRIIDAIKAGVDEVKKAGRLESDRVFAQLEALLWLRDMLDLDRPLPPTRGWAASPDLLLEVVKHIHDAQPEQIVEMGSGTSSVVIAASLRKWGNGRLFSLEHEPEHAARTRAEIELHGLSSVATVVDAPLGEVIIAGSPWRWYTVPPDGLPARIDMLFVDGPPAATWPLARYPAFPVFAERLRPVP